MNSDPDEGTSDGRVWRTRDCEQNSVHSDVTIKQEDGIKEEPNDNTKMVESNELPPAMPIAGSCTSLGIDIGKDTDNQWINESDFDRVKREIKIEEEEENTKKKPREGENEHSNGVDGGNRDDEHQNNPPTDSANNCKQKRLNDKVKTKGRNRILTKKRNMAGTSKTRKVRAKPQKIHKCSQCNFTAPKKSNFTRHIRVHTGERPFECDICAKSFTQKSTLTSHKKTHRSLFKVHCSKCRTRFEKEMDQINHEAKCKRRQYDCYLCKYSSRHVAHLKVHMRYQHTGQKPFGCSICSKTFTTKSDLACHSRIHKTQFPFACMKCGKRFVDHNEKHSHEKRCTWRRFECYICRYNCFHMSHLKQHMRSSHTGDKQFRCGICDKKFVHKGNLNQHLASHAQQRPVSCSKCMRRFKDENVKMEHEKRCNRRHYQCYLCKINRQQLRHLKTHLQMSHVEIKMPKN